MRADFGAGEDFLRDSCAILRSALGVWLIRLSVLPGLSGGGAKRIRTPDLLDANETTWTLTAESCDGCATNPQVKRLTATVAKNCSKFYCGLARRCGQPSKPGRTSQFRGTRRRHGPECAFDLVEHALLAIGDWHSSNPSGTRVM